MIGNSVIQDGKSRINKNEKEKEEKFTGPRSFKDSCGNCGYLDCTGMPYGKACGNWIPMSEKRW